MLDVWLLFDIIATSFNNSGANEMQAIGATIKYYWGDVAYHPEEEIENYTAYVSFGELDEDADVDSYGVSDDMIFYYAENEQELQDYMESPSDAWILVDYQLEYK